MKNCLRRGSMERDTLMMMTISLGFKCFIGRLKRVFLRNQFSEMRKKLIPRLRVTSHPLHPWAMIDIWLSQLCYRPTYLKLTLFSISNLVIIAFKLFQVEEEKKKEFRDSFLKTYKNGMINNDVTVWIHSSEKEKKKFAWRKSWKRLIIPVSWGTSCLSLCSTTKCEQDERHKVTMRLSV